ncbi:MAG: DUF1579 domain-containing protein [Burkholderiaceae bacterium]
MNPRRLLSASVTSCALAVAWQFSFAAGAPDSGSLLAAQRQSMLSLSVFDGTWRGPARIILPDGKEVLITQTERVGGFLGDTVKVIEGRGYAQDGTSSFNAFAVISYSPQTGKYNFRSYAQGHSGDFPLEVRPDGFIWSIKAGPATLRYTATVKDGVWTEVGERIVEGQPPIKTFEMTLRRIGATDWPAAGAVPPK